jgi:predicted P-loop ATPase
MNAQPDDISRYMEEVRARVASRREPNVPTTADAPKQLSGFECTPTGKVKPTCANARLAIENLRIECRYDAFHVRMLVGGQKIAEHAGELSDHACLVLRKLIDTEYGFDPGRNNMLDACVQLCLQRQSDPVRDYFDLLEWDGTRRVATWLTSYMGAEDNELHRHIGTIALVALVRRVRQPGCKFDTIPVFEGPEGKGKSSILRALAGSDENFTDQTILGRDDRTQQELMRGKLVVEIPDLAGMKKAEIEHVKAFASRTFERARPAYGRCVLEQPRRCVIFGTTNETTYLQSRTGNRRFWPVLTGRIDLEAFKLDREQLLAEAAQLEAEEYPIILPEELWSAAGDAQQARLTEEPWLDTLQAFRGAVFGQEERASTGELLQLLGIPVERQTEAHAKRLGHTMRELGWSGPERMRLGVGRDAPFKRGYRRLLGVTRVTSCDLSHQETQKAS